MDGRVLASRWRPMPWRARRRAWIDDAARRGGPRRSPARSSSRGSGRGRPSWSCRPTGGRCGSRRTARRWPSSRPSTALLAELEPGRGRAPSRDRRGPRLDDDGRPWHDPGRAATTRRSRSGRRSWRWRRSCSARWPTTGRAARGRAAGLLAGHGAGALRRGWSTQLAALPADHPSHLPADGGRARCRARSAVVEEAVRGPARGAVAGRACSTGTCTRATSSSSTAACGSSTSATPSGPTRSRSSRCPTATSPASPTTRGRTLLDAYAAGVGGRASTATRSRR